MRTDDGSIIQTCLNDEPEAFGILVDKYKAGIFAYIYARVNNFQDAQEITQDVFVCAYSGLHSLKRYESFSFWLFRIASNRCKRWQRNQIRHPQPESIDDVDPKAIDNSSIKSHHEEMMDQSVREALNTLPETYREVLLLYYFSDMDSKEIAESLGISPTAIRMRLSRAREHFKEEMIAMMGTAFENQRLHASFTFRIVEAIKRIKVQPISQTKGLPWGLSLVTGLIVTVLAFNPHLVQFNWDSLNSFLSSSSKTKVLEVGEFPVNILETSQIPNVSKGISEGKGESLKQPNIQNALFMAPQEGVAKWEKKTDMPTARYTYAAEVNGKIYAIGGSPDDANVLSTVEEYNPATNEWVKKASMPKPRALFGIAVANGKIYVMGGNRILMGKESLSTVEEYDPVADIWTTKADMLAPRMRFCACGVNGKIYAIAGDNNGAPVSFVEEYDPVLDKWTKKADIPTTRYRFSACVLNGKIYAIGGTAVGADIALSSIEEYDPVTDTWSKKRDMSTPRILACTAAVNGKIYAMGGANTVNGQIVVHSSVEKYDPIKDEWTKEKDMPIEAGVQYASVVDGKIYAIGGMAWGWVSLQAVLEYTPSDQDGSSNFSISPQGKIQNTWGKVKNQ
jgi:RNA polymerase sigma factor (sigma-70 family)